jgi:type IV pilus biogenesis protein CpaD/CtpE
MDRPPMVRETGKALATRSLTLQSASRKEAPKSPCRRAVEVVQVLLPQGQLQVVFGLQIGARPAAETLRRSVSNGPARRGVQHQVARSSRITASKAGTVASTRLSVYFHIQKGQCGSFSA